MKGLGLSGFENAHDNPDNSQKKKKKKTQFFSFKSKSSRKHNKDRRVFEQNAPNPIIPPI